MWFAACGPTETVGDDSVLSGSGGASGSGGPSGSGGQATGGVSTGGVSTGGAAGVTVTGGSASGGVSGTSSGGAGGAGATGGMAASGGMAAASGVGATGGRGGSGGVDGAGSGGKATGGSGGASGGAGGACPPTQLKSGDTTIMVMSGGVQRTALVHVPSSAAGGMTRVPLVMDFHGLTGNSNQQRQLSRWATLGDSEGFITVFPQGLPSDRPGWNAGGCCNTVADDVQFVRDMIAYLHTVACIDPKRIHASGCSNGGAMSYMLACNAADLVASVAPVDFDCVVGGQCSQCNPGRPISVIQFRGTNDSAVPYSGAMPNFDRWGDINMCTGTATALTENASCQTYPMCGAGAETILCSVQNGTRCGSYSSFMIPQLAWQILERHPMP